MNLILFQEQTVRLQNIFFYLAGGLKSQILGEDQILTQIKDALNLAREHFTTDSTLEVLFRMAVTAGKKSRQKHHLHMEIHRLSIRRSVT